MEYEHIEVSEEKGAVAVVTMGRPEQRIALSATPREAAPVVVTTPAPDGVTPVAPAPTVVTPSGGILNRITGTTLPFSRSKRSASRRRNSVIRSSAAGSVMPSAASARSPSFTADSKVSRI